MEWITIWMILSVLLLGIGLGMLLALTPVSDFLYNAIKGIKR